MWFGNCFIVIKKILWLLLRMFQTPVWVLPQLHNPFRSTERSKNWPGLRTRMHWRFVRSIIHICNLQEQTSGILVIIPLLLIPYDYNDIWWCNSITYCQDTKPMKLSVFGHSCNKNVILVIFIFYLSKDLVILPFNLQLFLSKIVRKNVLDCQRPSPLRLQEDGK